MKNIKTDCKWRTLAINTGRDAASVDDSNHCIIIIKNNNNYYKNDIDRKNENERKPILKTCFSNDLETFVFYLSLLM